MQIVLTHEQADFDAIGALLGAALLQDHAIPVLPRKMNRNVRAFLNLYGSEFPFVEPRDLPQEHIDSVTLVDTQSLVTLKGISAATRVQVIDHHVRRPGLEPGWQVMTERVGACTTLLVESLREHNGGLGGLHATLLLLGIYEDTGSLTYVSTTSRDVRAAAYLLEQGASLQVVSEYLNPPLSPEQRLVYDRLLSSAHSHTINGQTIVIAATAAEEMTEEISSVAHKLRDLLDPDALFILVGTIEGIRMVARSTTDQINVSSIAAEFNGGGHERAASALIRPETLPSSDLPPLEYVCARLLEILPRYVRPSLTVGQIMSSGKIGTLSPETSAQEAEKLMRRYGYEGYPIVQDGRVLGLLTRRAVDRALSHRLNLTAASLMEAGEITVSPGDTLDHLQRLMASTGWGQIPVVGPDGRMIGIVTRTDLLKFLGSRLPSQPGRKNLAERLSSTLPPAQLALLEQIAKAANTLHFPVYIVGGFVRDLLLDLPGLDLDIVVEGDAIALANQLNHDFGGRVVAHHRFGTAKWQIKEIHAHLLRKFDLPPDVEGLPDALDLITARTEFYDHPTALPTVERSSIKLDLHRRDFTINTLALRLDGRHYGDLYDYWGGLGDLDNHLVRVLHSLSFIDDPTRMLRAVRFEQRFDFEIEARTRELMSQAHDLLRQVTGERLRHEFDLIFIEPRAAAMMERLENLDLLQAIHPALSWDTERTTIFDLLTRPPESIWPLPDKIGGLPLRCGLGYLAWLGRYPVEMLDAIGDTLRFSHPLLSVLKHHSRLIRELPTLAQARPSEITVRLDDVPLIAIYALAAAADPVSEYPALAAYITHWQKIQPLTNGLVLRQLGLPPGPTYRSVLSRLRAAWLDGEIHTPEEEQKLLDQLLAEYPGAIV